MAIAKLVWPALIVGTVLMLRRAGAGAYRGGGSDGGEAGVAPPQAAVGDRAGQHH